jgi:hypothetical protein
MIARPPPSLRRIAELEAHYADEYPTTPRQVRKQWAVAEANVEADERHAIQNEDQQ